MREGGYGKKRMSRETGLSYNTIIKYLERMDAEAKPEAPPVGTGDPEASAASTRRTLLKETRCAPHGPRNGAGEAAGTRARRQG